MGLLLAGVAVVATSGGWRHYLARRRECRSLSQEMALTRLRLEEKTRRLARTKDPTFLAREARCQLGLLKPGEIEFRFRPSVAPPEGPPCRRRSS